jgi:hypothetical protein
MTEKELKETTSSVAIAQMEQTDGLDCVYADDDDSLGIRRLKFGDQGRGPWKDRATGELIPADLLLTLVKYRQGYQRFFGEGVPPQIIELGPDDKFDEEAQNKKVPREEWEENPFTGELQGPYRGFRELLFIDEKTMTLWSYSCSITTSGGSQGIKELRRIVRWARKYKGPGLSPRVLLRDAPMPTKKYGIVPRPYFEIQNNQWAATASHSLNEAPTMPALAAPATPTDDGVGVEETETVDIADSIPY